MCVEEVFLMRLKVTKSKNAASLYVIKSVYNSKTQSNTSVIVEKLGTEKELREKLNGQDPYEWARNYIEKLNEQEKAEKRKVLVPFAQAKLIEKDKQRSFNGGYLFLQQIYYALGLDKICKDISSRHDFDYDLNAILSRLVYSRVLFPASKLATAEISKKFLEEPGFEPHQIYRALSVLAEESDFIQQMLYKNSLKYTNRKTGIIYYDCTNYFFEIEEPDVDGDRQYGKSKENRPNPIVQMGLFMDGDGIPLAFSINPGNTNEQITLKPLEQKLLDDFGMSKFVVCTDAGLASTTNRKFNDMGERAFITTQSIKMLKQFLKEWSLEESGWHLPGSDKSYNLSNLDKEKDYDKIFYKERWINENGLEQKLIVTFSLKYKEYQQKIRNGQIERAQKVINSNPAKLKKTNANDYRRFINQQNCTDDGEIAEHKIYSINQERVAEEEQYDGFYAVCTNLTDDTTTVVRINQKRWEIEECFRIMKSEFKARPVYLQRSDRIQAHFMTCFAALIVYRFLEKKLDEKYTCSQLIQTLQEMNFYQVAGEGYIPTYTRTDLTDALHEAFEFRTDYQIVTNRQMKKIFRATKK